MEHNVTIYDEINLSLYAQYQHMYQFFYQYRAISIGKKGKPIAFKRNVDVFRTILGQMLKQDIRIGNTPNILKVSLKMCLCYHVLIILSNGNAFNFYCFILLDVNLFPTIQIAYSIILMQTITSLTVKHIQKCQHVALIHQ